MYGKIELIVDLLDTGMLPISRVLYTGASSLKLTWDDYLSRLVVANKLMQWRREGDSEPILGAPYGTRILSSQPPCTT